MRVNQKIILGILLLNLSSLQCFSESISVSQLQELQIKPATYKQAELNENHWIFETLNDFNKKYNGSILDNKALTRQEAAFILVNLIGKVQESNIQINESDKALLNVMKKELSTELDQLSKRVTYLEESASTIKGKVSELEEADKKNLKFDYGENFKITGSFQAGYVGNFTKGSDQYPSNFRIPLSEVYVSGNVKPNLSYTINMVPTTLFTSSSNAILADAFLQTKLNKNHSLQLGQTTVPIGQEGPMWLISAETADKAQYARNYGDRLDLGAKLIGNWDFADYYLGVFNGSGINSTDSNRRLATAGWLNIKPFSKSDKELLKGFEVGSGYYHGNNSLFNETTLGAYAGYKYKRLKLRGEYQTIKGYQNERQRANSWYALGLFNLTDKIDLVGRYDVFDPNSSTAKNSNIEYTFGGNYKLSDHIQLKLNYVLVNAQSGKNSNRINLLSQYLF